MYTKTNRALSIIIVGVYLSVASNQAQAQQMRSSSGNPDPSATMAGKDASPLLAELRSELSGLGLGRREEVSLYEDHLAAVLETMRVLITGVPGRDPRGITEQRKLFAAYVASWVPACCTAIRAKTIANYYRQVAEFTDSFVAIERDSFAIE